MLSSFHRLSRLAFETDNFNMVAIRKRAKIGGEIGYGSASATPLQVSWLGQFRNYPHNWGCMRESIPELRG